MNPAIFREYDIRGLAEKDFDGEFAFLLGKVHGTNISRNGGKRVTVGRDCRATSDAYAEAVIAGLASTGLHVYDIGVCPTPLLRKNPAAESSATKLFRPTRSISSAMFLSWRVH